MRRTLLAVAALAPIWLLGQAEEPIPRSFDLLQAQQYAAEHSYLVQNSALEIEKAQKQLWEITSIGLPQVSASADYSYSPKLAQQPIPAEFFGGEPGTFQTVAFGTTHSSQAGIQLNQLIFDGTYLLAVKGSALYKKIKADEHNRNRIDVRDQVAQAYYNVKLSDEAEKILEDNLEALTQNLTEVQALFKAGFLEEQDADQLEYLVNGLRLDLENTRRSREVALKAFKVTIGFPMDSALVLTQTLESLYYQNVDGQPVLEQAFQPENHIDYRIIENQAAGADLQVKQKQWSYAPTINGFLNHNQNNFSNDNFNLFDYDTYWIPSTIMGFGVKLPLFTSGARWAQVGQAKIARQQAEVAKTQVGESLQLEYEQAKSEYLYATDKLRNEMSNRDLTKRIRDRTMVKYNEGVGSSLDLTQTQNQYLQTEGEYLRSVLSLLNAKSRLDKVLGNYNP
ncbi:hypothetical protein GC167_00975 [bacterium]|nr:hypothetical protein [bacterium]